MHLAKYIVSDMVGRGDGRILFTSKDDPAQVAEMGYEALLNGDERVIASSLSTKIQGR